MRAQGSGVIVDLSAFGARLGGGPFLAMYATSKHAISRFSESLQAELSGTGVRVVAIEPGFFATEIYEDNKHRSSSSRHSTRRSPSANMRPPFQNPASPTCVLVGDDAIAAFNAYRRTLMTAWSAELSDE